MPDKYIIRRSRRNNALAIYSESEGRISEYFGIPKLKDVKRLREQGREEIARNYFNAAVLGLKECINDIEAKGYENHSYSLDSFLKFDNFYPALRPKKPSWQGSLLKSKELKNSDGSPTADEVTIVANISNSGKSIYVLVFKPRKEGCWQESFQIINKLFPCPLERDRKLYGDDVYEIARNTSLSNVNNFICEVINYCDANGIAIKDIYIFSGIRSKDHFMEEMKVEYN